MRRYHTLLLALLCTILLSHSPAKSQGVAPTTDPIEHIGQVTTPWLEGMVSTGTFAYALNVSKIEMIDLSQPDQPRHVGTYAPAWRAYSIELAGNLLFVISNPTCPNCTNPTVLRVLDISNPAQPVEIGAYNASSDSYISEFVATTNYVYLPTFRELTVLDIGNPAAPRRIGGLATPNVGSPVEYSNGYLYTLDGQDKLNVFDVRNPAQPVQVAEGFDIPLRDILDTAISGNLFYAATGACPSQICSGIVRFVDISNPAQPISLGYYTLSYEVANIEAIGPYLYLVRNGATSYIDILDMRTINQPKLIASTNIGPWVPQKSIAIVNSYIHVATTSSFFVKRYRFMSAPFGTAPHTVPGVIQAEDFDHGGPAAAYVDADTGNRGQVYRPDESVDLQPTTDQGGGHNVGWTAGGEWLQYTIDVGETNSYQLQLRLASNGGGGDLHVEIDGTSVAKLTNLPNTGGYQAWQTISLGSIPLNAGTHTLRLVMDRNGQNNTVANFNFLQLLPPLDHTVYVPVTTQP